MQFLKQKLFPAVYRHAAVFLLVGLTTVLLLPWRDYLGTQVIPLIFLLPVMLSTFLWGLTPGVLAGFVSFLASNYFFIPPYHTLAVHRTLDLITLIVFLIIAVVTSQLIGQAREGMRLARSREWEATRMYELLLALAGLQDNQSILRTLAQHTLETFHCKQVQALIQDSAGKAPGNALGNAPGFAQGKTLISVIVPEGSSEPELPTLSAPLETARGQEGEIRLWVSQADLTQEENRLLHAFTSQGALSIERIRLSESMTRTHILEETDRAKSSLLSSVSHELRSPLAVIKASISSLHSGLVDWESEARQELLATVEEETDHLNFLVGNLLDMSRIEAGALKPQRKWNSLAEIAMGVITRMRNQLKDYRVEMRVPADMPLVPTDYVMIDQVFTNLISNSVKFAPTGSLITITACKEPDVVHFQVTNQGPPVPEENLARIFDKFYQVSPKDRITGAGLGLSICKGIVEAHEGKIWAENTPCCFIFHFTLPLEMDGNRPNVPLETSNE